MTIHKYQRFISLVITLISFDSFALSADRKAGENKAEMCQTCHGKEGNSKNSQFPTLAGQPANYLEYQLKGYQSGNRTNEVMQNLVANFTRQDIKDISAYFSKIPPKSAGANGGLAAKGKSKATRCLGCHGNNAQGRGGFPRLAGQHPEYLKNQLLAFKNRSRKGGPMNSVVRTLSEQDIEEISAYLGSL